MNAREAAYQALLSSLREELFIQQFLESWNQKHSPSTKDYHLAQEIAYGTMRRQLTLDHFAHQLNPKLKLKRKEKVLLWMALYQASFMDKIPLHAIVNESVEMAKKVSHSSFAQFLNALLRKIPEIRLTLPIGDDPKSLSIRYSYPEYFIQELLMQTGIQQTIAILEAGNLPGKTMARKRTPPFSIETLDNPKERARSTDIYIQNITPATLILECAKRLPSPPKKILDLCASPGGKALLAHDLFPEAELTVNDISDAKLKRIRENFQKYNVQAEYTLSPGESLSTNERYDLIILDVPCSNSGVLNKRPEARWRITPESLSELRGIQEKLVQHSLSLLNPGGRIWYLTCSILECETPSELLHKDQFSKLIYPNQEGWDGGYACILEAK